MAELHLYKCKKCGWEVEAPSEGADILMDSIMACYVCHDSLGFIWCKFTKLLWNNLIFKLKYSF